MNKAITDGIVFTPPQFSEGLDVWSSEDGRPGQASYDGASNASYVPADANFAGCIELLKTQNTQKLRYTGQTLIIPGCYLQIKARVKLVSGAFPTIRIGAWAGRAGNNHLDGVIEFGPSIQLTNYGEVFEISAIVGSGNRPGVDMAWGKDALFGHFGIDMTGLNGGVVRIDDISIEDVTGAYVDQLIGAVDVRDYGAVGDGVTDDHDAFEAADDAANGREVLVPRGTFRIASSITFQSRVRFVGKLSMPDDARLTLLKDFNLPSYIDAFDDEVQAFKKAFQSLLNFNDHDSLDMGGRRIELTEPIDMQAAVGNKDTFAIRRVIRNGQFQALQSPDFETDVVTAIATYSSTANRTLSGITNIANIAVGSLVEGSGVGREIYVTSVDISSQSLTLNRPLYDAYGTQNYTFSRFKYMLDFGGFAQLSMFVFDDIDFQCGAEASGVMLPQDGLSLHFRDCFFTKPKNRGITSVGSACQGMLIDRCQFLSHESSLKVQDRTSIGLNVNKNDVKIRDCRIVHLKHFCILGGTGYSITGNHWFHGDTEVNGVRKAGIVFTTPNVVSFITGNYIDNNFIELTNEHDDTPDFGNQLGFGGLTITGNIFLMSHAAPWTAFIVVKPYGTGHTLFGLNVTGNVFRTLSSNIDKVEAIDTTFADINRGSMRNIVFQGNTFNGINSGTFNPLTRNHTESSDNGVWTLDTNGHLPFEGQARTVEAVVKNGRIRSGDDMVLEQPFTVENQGPNLDQVKLGWSQPCRGQVTYTVRADKAD